MKTTFTSAALPLIGSDWTKLFSSCFVIIAFTIVSAQNASSQDGEDEPVVVQVHDVSEFVTARSDQPFGGFVIPGISASEPSIVIAGGGSGYGGGGGGGGVFNIAPFGPPQLGGGRSGGGQTFGYRNGGNMSQLTTDDLADVIMDSVRSDTWAQTGGGPGKIRFMGTTMIVSQTPTVHKQIETLLKMLGQTKASTKNQSVVAINAIWLTIDETQFATLATKSDRSVDEEALKKLTEDFGRRGQITCFDGQRVHIAAGNLRSSVETVIPVVGQSELPGPSVKAIAKTNPLSKLPKNVMAQVSNSSLQSLSGSLGGDGPNKIGYKPVPLWTSYGTVLQVLPRVETDQQIWLDVSSTVVRPGEASPKMKMGQMEIDKHNMHCQQFKTSIRVNDSTPTLVAGSAFDDDTEGKLQTYLILEASKIVKPAK